MNNEITLKRVVTGEFAPQYWTMTGGEFDAMLAAVKSLPFRQWQQLEKCWQVKYDGIQALREAGYTVVKESDVRIELRNGQESIEKGETSVNVEIVLNYRRPTGEWSVRSNVTNHFSTYLHFDFALSQIEEIARQVSEDETVRKHISAKNMDAYCHDTAILRLAQKAVHDLNSEAQACYKEHQGKRTIEEYKAAVEAVWSKIDEQ